MASFERFVGSYRGFCGLGLDGTSRRPGRRRHKIGSNGLLNEDHLTCFDYILKPE